MTKKSRQALRNRRERHALVISLATLASSAGYEVGYYFDATLDDPENWPVVAVDLPTGLTSFPIPGEMLPEWLEQREEFSEIPANDPDYGLDKVANRLSKFAEPRFQTAAERSD